jgi:hypothetical protein
MRTEHIIGLAGSAFIAISALVMLAVLRRGRNLCRELLERFPREYDALGSPAPALLNSPSVTAYYRFILGSGWSRVPDEGLRQRFLRLRRIEYAQLVFVCAGLAAFAVSLLYVG